MNIYEMYVKNGKKVGFKIRRRSWAKISYGVIILIGNQVEGELGGKAPYYGNPRVIMEFYRFGKYRGVSEVSCAGTYDYEMVGE